MRPVAGVVTAVLVALGALVAPTAGAGTRQTAEPSGSVELVGRSPWVGAEDVLRLDISAPAALDPALVRVQIHARVDSVESLERVIDDDAGRVLHQTPRLPIGFIPALPDESHRLEIPVSETGADGSARLDRPGVYPVSITVTDGQDVTTIRTPVVRLGTDEEPLPTADLALLLDMTVAPSVEADGRRGLDEGELDRLDRLAAVLDGRDLGSAQRPPPVTLLPSADTIDALTASDDPRAARVLDALAAVDGERAAVGTPYVPLDATALGAADLGELLAPVLASGRAVLGDRIGGHIENRLWNAPGGVSPAGAALLAPLGVDHVLVDSGDDARSPAAERALVGAGPVTVPELPGVGVLTVDAPTSDAFAARAVDRVDAGHIALAELIVRGQALVEERAEEATAGTAGAGAPTVIVRVGDVPDDSVIARLVPLLSTPGSPVRPVTVDPAALAAAPAVEGDDEDPVDTDGEAFPILDDAPADTEVLRAMADEVRAVSAAVGSFAGMVDAESARADELRLRVATALASDVAADRRRDLLGSVRGVVDGAFGSVALTGQTDVNLTSRSGTLPLMVRNDNEFPVVVVLRVRSERLEFPEGVRFELAVTEEITRIDVPVDARATGSVPTFVELLTPDEALVLDSRRLDVRSTAVSGVGLALSVGALIVLVVWWARTWHRSRREDQRQDDGVSTDAPPGT